MHKEEKIPIGKIARDHKIPAKSLRLWIRKLGTSAATAVNTKIDDEVENDSAEFIEEHGLNISGDESDASDGPADDMRDGESDGEESSTGPRAFPIWSVDQRIDIVRKWRASGLTQADFIEEHGLNINASQLSHWHTHLKDENGEPLNKVQHSRSRITHCRKGADQDA